jgi:hypothetical protein
MSKNLETKEQVSLRIQKAIEVKTNFNKMMITEDSCNNLKEFSGILNEWVKTGHYASGKIKLPEANYKIIYTLSSPKFTVVKLTKLQ